MTDQELVEKAFEMLQYSYVPYSKFPVGAVLESIDGETLHSFAMDGIGEFIFNSLSKFIGNDVKKSDNPLDEVIEELKHFMPYGKYFK